MMTGQLSGKYNFFNGAAAIPDVMQMANTYLPQAQSMVGKIYGNMTPPENAGFGDSITLKKMAAGRGQDVMQLLAMLMGQKMQQAQGNQANTMDAFKLYLENYWKQKQYDDKAKIDSDNYWNSIHGIGGSGGGQGGGAGISWMPSSLTGNSGGGMFQGMQPFGYNSGGGLGQMGGTSQGGWTDYVGQGGMGQQQSSYDKNGHPAGYNYGTGPNGNPDWAGFGLGFGG